MSLRIGVDARELEVKPRGVGRILSNVLREWGRHCDRHQFVLYLKNDAPDLDCLKAPHFQIKTLPLPASIKRHRIWEQIFLPSHIKKDRIDVLFSPTYTVPLFAGCPTVVGIHDIAYQTHPEWFSFRDGVLLRWFTRWSVRRAAKIICCSRHTQKEVLAHYGNRFENKISTVYLAPDESFHPGPHEISKTPLASKYKISQPFFLFVGSLFKRRNIPLFLRAFKKFSEAHADYSLVLIGNDDELNPGINALAQNLGLQGKVMHLNYVREEDLKTFYQAAFCFVHPSSYEGFGLPSVEAMACGTPVICSDAETLVEIAQGAARVVSPFNEETLAQEMKTIVEQPELRNELVKKGLERAGKLSWKETASSTMKLIEEAADVGKG